MTETQTPTEVEDKTTELNKELSETRRALANLQAEQQAVKEERTTMLDSSDPELVVLRAAAALRRYQTQAVKDHLREHA